MSQKTYGYIRVSTKDQNEDRQRIAMREFGILDRHVFMDKQSGKDFERPGYKRLITKPRASTGWAAAMRRFWSSGGSLQK